MPEKSTLKDRICLDFCCHERKCNFNQLFCKNRKHYTNWKNVPKLDPPIPLYPVPVPPLPDADDDDIDGGAEQNNPSGGAAADDNDVVFFDALAALPAVDDYLGPSADADDLDPASNLTGLSADGSGAPSAPDASLGLLADRGNTPENDDVAEMGPDDDGDVADPGDGASGDRPLGLLTRGDVGPQASSGGTDGSASRDAPLAADASSLGLLAGWSTSQGDDGISGEGPDDVDGDVANPVGDGASGDRPPDLSIGGNIDPLASCGGTNGSAGVDAPSAADAPLGLSAGLSTLQGDDDVAGMGPDDVDGDVADPGDGASGDSTLGHSAGENVGPPASPGGTNGSADGRDAPLTIAMNVGPGTTEEDVGGANVGSPDANLTPAGRSARLYPLFIGRSGGSGRRIASAGRGGTAQRVSLSPAAVAALPVDAVQAGGGIEGVAVRALDTSRAEGTTGGVALCAPGPPPPRLVPRTVETAAALAANPGTAICTDGCAGGTCVDGRTRTFVLATILAATAPAVANPYTNTAHGTAADTGGVVGGAVGAPVALCDGTPAPAGAAAVGDDAPADDDVQGAHGHSTPRTFTEEELRDADPRLQRLMAADQRLLGIFDDTIHLNDGTHLDGGIGINEDARWQRLHTRVASCSLPLYDLPKGRWAHRFRSTLTDLWVRVIQRRWNSERPLVFQAVILHRVRGIMDSMKSSRSSEVGLTLGTRGGLLR